MAEFTIKLYSKKGSLVPIRSRETPENMLIAKVADDKPCKPSDDILKDPTNPLDQNCPVTQSLGIVA